MGCEIRKSVLYAMIGGIIIEDIQLFAYYFIFPRFDINYLIVITVVFGTFVALVTIFARNKSVGYSLLRWLMLMIFCFLVLLFNAYTGITRFLLSICDGGVGAGTQNVIGLQSLFTSIAIFGNTLIIILIRAVFFKFVMLYKNK